MGITFDAVALVKCFDRLESAREDLFKARNAKSGDEFRKAYANFLISTGGALNAIDAGTKETPQGRQWYGSKKRLRRGDELLQYMFQARNAEEHTTDIPGAVKGGGMSIGGPLKREPGAPVHGLYVGNQAIIEISPGKAR